MDIAIVGAGNVGRALAGSFTRAGHHVVLASRDVDNAREAAALSGAEAAESVVEAVRGADVVVLAVPYPSLTDVVETAGEALAGKVVVDATNPLTADYSGLAVEGTSAAEQIQARLPRSHVVKAFNTVFAARQADPTVEGAPVDGFVAGDDQEAKAQVLALEESIGMRPIDAGPLAMARALEAMALLNITLQVRNNWAWQTSWRLAGPTTA
jgi:8-hydroxy-5-deazaflavin:NADPH oxidoreductase